MPTEAVLDGSEEITSDSKARDRSARNLGLRLGLAPATLFALGMLFNWPVFYLAAVFAALFTQAPVPMPVSAGVRLLGLSAIMLAAAWVLSAALLPYPIVFLACVALALGAALRAAIQGANVLVVVLAMLAALLVPFLAKLSLGLAGLVSVWLVINMALAMLAGWAAFALFPAGPLPETSVSQKAPAFDPERRLARMCLVSIPFAVFFFAIESDAALVLIFVAILATQLAASTAAGPVVARVMMLANVLGGIAAVLIYEALVIAPFLPLAMLLVFAACLFFAARAAAGNPLAGSALTAVLILVGGSLGPISDGAEVKMLTRLWQVGLALIYILSAFVLVDRWLPEKEQPRSEAP